MLDVNFTLIPTLALILIYKILSVTALLKVLLLKRTYVHTAIVGCEIDTEDIISINFFFLPQNLTRYGLRMLSVAI